MMNDQTNHTFKYYRHVLALILIGFTSTTAQPQIQKSVTGAGAVLSTVENSRLTGTPRVAAASFGQSADLPLPAGLQTRAIACDLIVTNGADAGAGSLRDAVACALPGDVITFDYDGVITLTSGEMLIDKALTIDGFGHDVTIDGNNNSRIFYIDTPSAVSVRGLTFQNGIGDFGGAILSRAELNVVNCSFHNTMYSSRGMGGSSYMGGGGGSGSYY